MVDPIVFYFWVQLLILLSDVARSWKLKPGWTLLWQHMLSILVFLCQQQVQEVLLVVEVEVQLSTVKSSSNSRPSKSNLLLNTLSYTCATSSMSLVLVTLPTMMRKLTQWNSRPNWIASPRQYIEGIQPIFDPLKACCFDSSWNWASQDALVMFCDSIFGRPTTVDCEITTRCIALLNHVDPELLTYMQYHIDQVDLLKGNTYQLVKQFGQQLIGNTCKVIGQPPVYKDGMSDFYF